MSFGILWPSRLTTIGDDSVFWLPTVNDNMRLVNDALSPAVAALLTIGGARPNRVLTWGRDGTQYRVRQDVQGIGIAGVAVGHTSANAYTLTKLYGGAVIECNHAVTAADVGKLAVLTTDGMVELTSGTAAAYDRWVGVVVGVARTRMLRVLLRYFGEHLLAASSAYTRNDVRAHGPIAATAMVADVQPGPAAYSESHLFFTYLGTYDEDHPELYNVAAPGVNTGQGSCESAVNFEVSGGYVVQGTSGAVMTLHLERGYATAGGSASIVDAAEDGGTGIRIACDVQGQIVTLTLGAGSWQGQGVKQVHVAIAGVLTEG